ncbi:MAG: ArsR/SmtB family transcription factor [Conexivisphaera sp.]|jgi:ArsR family transcriptional regulator|nr:metalloregulator ArsR/SmtB family transcription factor [Conexivisphaerales archaeon]
MVDSNVSVVRFSECGLAEKGKEEEYLKKLLDDVASVIDQDKMTMVSRVMRALADPTRVRIVAMAKARRKLYECEIVGAFGLAQPTASYHLRLLSDAGVLAKRREGKMIAYVPSDGLGWAIAEQVLETAKR